MGIEKLNDPVDTIPGCEPDENKSLVEKSWDSGPVKWFTLKLFSGSTTLAIRSRAGVGTSIYVESSKNNTMTFDTGVDIPDYTGKNGRSKLGKHIFLTHTHGDHIYALASSLLSAQCKDATYHIYVPRSKNHHIFKKVLGFLRASAKVSGDTCNTKYTQYPIWDYYESVLLMILLFLLSLIVLISFRDLTSIIVFVSTLFMIYPKYNEIKKDVKDPARAFVSFANRTLYISEVNDEMIVSKGHRIVRAFPSVHEIESNAYVVYDVIGPAKKFTDKKHPCNIWFNIHKKCDTKMHEDMRHYYSDGIWAYQPVLTISGDTTAELWVKHPQLMQSQVVLAEATRFDGPIDKVE